MSNAQKKTVAVYYRVRHNSGFALTQQISNVKTYAIQCTGGNVVFEYGDVCSGCPNCGKGLRALMKAAREHRFDTLIVLSLSRITRNPLQARSILTMLSEYGVRVESMLNDTHLLGYAEYRS